MSLPVKIQITQQGAPVINSGIVYREYEKMVALEIDLTTKHCVVSATTGGLGCIPGIYLDATPDSLGIHPDKTLDDSTCIGFPDYPGWNVWSANLGRYTLCVCLVN